MQAATVLTPQSPQQSPCRRLQQHAFSPWTLSNTRLHRHRHLVCTQSVEGVVTELPADVVNAVDTTEVEKPESVARIEDYFESKELVEELQDTKQFGQRGELWFILRSIACLLVLLPPLQLLGVVHAIGTISLVLGIAFIVYGILSLGRNWSPLPTPRRFANLVTTGMFAYVRHPVYGGLIMSGLGLAAITASESRLVLTLLLWFVIEQTVKVEEAALAEKFSGYDAYRSQVKKFFPYVY